MKRPSMRMVTALSVLISALVSASAQASPKIVYVSASGNDANACTRNQPCKTFAFAASVVASGGEVLALDSGSYGYLSINKSLTVEASPGVYASIQVTATDAIDVNPGPSGVVVLRGLILSGSSSAPTGVSFLSGTLFIENCVIQGFSGDSLRTSSANGLFVSDTVFRNNGGRGIWLDSDPSASLTASFNRCRFEHNGLSAIEVFHRVKMAIRDSVASGNLNGFILEDEDAGPIPSEINVDNCLLANNTGIGVGVDVSPFGTVRLSGSTVTGNGTGLDGPGLGDASVFESFGDNHVRGNTVEVSGTITHVNHN